MVTRPERLGEGAERASDSRRVAATAELVRKQHSCIDAPFPPRHNPAPFLRAFPLPAFSEVVPVITPLCARRGAPRFRCVALLACGWMFCAASLPAGELPPSVAAAAGQAATVRPLLPGPLGPLPEIEAELPPAGPLGGPAAALAQPPGSLLDLAHTLAPSLPSAPSPGHDPDAPGGCGCPDCAAGGGGPHIYATPDALPMYAPSEAESLEATLLPDIEEDWFGRPVYGGGYAGVLVGGEIIASQLKLEPGLVTGLRIGQDCDRRWTWESNFAYASPEVINLEGPELRRGTDLFFGDTSLIYSRYATKRLRPYVSAGMGAAYFDLVDQTGKALHEFMPTVPLGAGLQYRYQEWLVLHLSVRDNLTLGQGELEKTMHNLTLTGGLEFRFGVTPNVYYPWMARAQSAW